MTSSFAGRHDDNPCNGTSPCPARCPAGGYWRSPRDEYSARRSPTLARVQRKAALRRPPIQPHGAPRFLVDVAIFQQNQLARGDLNNLANARRAGGSNATSRTAKNEALSAESAAYEGPQPFTDGVAPACGVSGEKLWSSTVPSDTVVV